MIAAIIGGIIVVLIAIAILVLMYNYAIAPAYGFPRIWGN